MNILLIGSNGKMAREFICACKEQDINIIAGVDINYNKPTNESPCSKMIDDTFATYSTIGSVIEKCDIVVDFSTGTYKKQIIEYIKQNKKPIAIFSTTWQDKDKDEIKKLSKKVPVLLNSNASIGINAMMDMLPTLCDKLNSADIVLTEYHHKTKLDSPSGTAKSMLSILEKKYKKAQVNVVRAGTEKGYHKIEFILNDEVLSISHRASSRKIFALGALEMTKKLFNKRNGFFTSL